MSDLGLQPQEPVFPDLDVIVVGAGFAGLYSLYRFRELGLRVRVLEAGDGVGGTWFWNRYPGARCDAESVDYSYSFSAELQNEWDWTERWATQPEILRYLNHVADRFDLRQHVELSTRVLAAIYDEAQRCWIVEADTGVRYSARFCVMATGCLSAANLPAFAGLERFAGRWYHTARWPAAGVDFSGRRVGFIGTGSTGIQAIPQIARAAHELTVFQRTANYSLPARNYLLDDSFRAAIRTQYPERREQARHNRLGNPFEFPTASALEVSEAERQQTYERAWQSGGGALLWETFGDLITNVDANRTAADFVRAEIRKTVRDPRTAELLTPHDHPIGSKRICIDIDYYETYNRDNVRLVDARTNPIREVTPTGLIAGSEEHRFDDLVFATGFDAMTGALARIDIQGVCGQLLSDAWSDGPRTYLGLAVADFPNLFLVTGPGSPSVLSNMVTSIEQHVDWIADCLAWLRSGDIDRIEAERDAQDAWVAHVIEAADATLYPLANSWYVGANIPGKARVVMPYVAGVGAYRDICDRIAANGYEGFARAHNERLAAAGRADA
jgi:cyclohexanone monooxygenase